ncbi:carboxypeptidase-like regulatory domain-containing protein [Pontibacter vulgaris]|uniref:carboxypeptidase-like regulatory domain-containing protein n=1 Tax=Pontibacter vulgaris TaxID=2905679 RepID=UPI001FA72D69|nr:carboxypeptidase-like regulatory domain-containing protein [Pontibacter vulgaris]
MRPRLPLLLLLLLICSSTPLIAQTILVKGKVTNMETGEPIAYASVGVAGKELGTIANSQGNFQVKIPAESITDIDKLIISSIGYEQKELPVKYAGNGTLAVKLKPQAIGLHEVAVRPRKLKAKVLGKNDREYFTSAVFFTRYDVIDDKLGKETGNIISINKSCYLNDFNIYVNYNEFKSIRFRLNLYAVREGLPQESLLKEDIQFDIRDRQTGWIQVDLRKYNLHVEGVDKIAVTMQWLESKGIDENSKLFNISTAISPAHKGVFRNKSEANWVTYPFYHSMYFNSDCYKEKSENTIAG